MSRLKQRPCLVCWGKEEFLSPEKQKKSSPLLPLFQLIPVWAVCDICIQHHFLLERCTHFLETPSVCQVLSPSSLLAQTLAKCFPWSGSLTGDTSPGVRNCSSSVEKGCLDPTTAQAGMAVEDPKYRHSFHGGVTVPTIGLSFVVSDSVRWCLLSNSDAFHRGSKKLTILPLPRFERTNLGCSG